MLRFFSLLEISWIVEGYFYFVLKLYLQSNKLASQKPLKPHNRWTKRLHILVPSEILSGANNSSNFPVVGLEALTYSKQKPSNNPTLCTFTHIYQCILRLHTVDPEISIAIYTLSTCIGCLVSSFLKRENGNFQPSKLNGLVFAGKSSE